jgi:hypothetical protein
MAEHHCFYEHDDRAVSGTFFAAVRFLSIIRNVYRGDRHGVAKDGGECRCAALLHMLW